MSGVPDSPTADPVTRIPRVAEVLRKLPVRDDCRFKLDALALQLEFASVYFEQFDLPNAFPGGSRAAVDALDEFIRLSEKLALHIQNMPAEAISAIECAIDEDNTDRLSFVSPAAMVPVPLPWLHLLRPPQDLRNRLNHYSACALTAKANVPKHSKARQGRRSKSAATAVARTARRAYEELTGLPVTRRTKRQPVNAHQDQQKSYGPFQDFLSELFATLGIEASAESQLKIICAEKKTRKRTTKLHKRAA